MLPFMRKKKSTAPDASTDTNAEPKAKRGSWLQRLSGSLKKTRLRLSDGLSNLLLGKREIDTEVLTDLSDILIQADIGIQTSQYIIDTASAQLSRQQRQDGDALLQAIQQVLLDILTPCNLPLNLQPNTQNALLMIGVNGAGKTTSIAKLAYYFKNQQQRVMLAAGDTFRAAAVEQLQTWGQRHDIPVIAQVSGADSAAVIYDAMSACQARNYDLLLADTAGRLHTQDHLIQELSKVKRVMSKVNPDAPHATILVLDATAGQNGLIQAKQFNQEIGIDGIILTKLDSSAKGGIIFAIANELKLPIYFIGVGESIDDLQLFNPKEFVDALFVTSNRDEN